MYRFTVRTAAFALAIALVAALPAAGQIIPAGDDRWVTPGDGRTQFQFPAGEVEGLCGATPSNTWNHTIRLAGVPEPGYDWDTVVSRLDDVDISSGYGAVPIQVRRMVFRSMGPHATPCGDLHWLVEAVDNQAITEMEIFRKTKKGGIFIAKIAVHVVFTAYDSGGNALGRLDYTLELPEKGGGTPWSFSKAGSFRPGIDDNENCIDVLREKLGYATGDHVYFIEDLIAAGKCREQ